MACLLAVSTIVVAHVLSGVDADDRSVVKREVMRACKEVANSDKRINYNFCVSELDKNYKNGEEGGVSLRVANAAAFAASHRMDSAYHDIYVLIEKLGADLNKTRLGQALDQCWRPYNNARIDFTIALQLIDSKSYAEAKMRFSRATEGAIQCDDVLAKAKIDVWPLVQHSKYAVQMGRICVAIGDRMLPKMWKEISGLLQLQVGADYIFVASLWLSNKKFTVTNMVSSAAMWSLWKLRNSLHFQRTIWRDMKSLGLWKMMSSMLQQWMILCTVGCLERQGDCK
ncbi:hypothetical protein EJB05_21425, partial [Eragrostis curvula]